MCALLQAGQAAGINSHYVHIGDLNWWLYYPPLGASFWEHIYLWDDRAGDRLFGWALLDPHGETFDVYYQPELHATSAAAEMLGWAENAAVRLARSKGSKQTGMFWVIPQDDFRIRWLESCGYKVQYQSVALCRSLADPIPDCAVPDGFELRTCRGLDEVESRARAQYGAFESEALFEQYVERFTRFMQSPAYHSAADIIAAAPDGSVAAFAVTWIDPVNRVGLFEPVGTHPAYQRKGLGRALMYEALRRLKIQGMEQAILCTGEQNTPAVQLYLSVGFRQYNNFRFYSKDI